MSHVDYTPPGSVGSDAATTSISEAVTVGDADRPGEQTLTGLDALRPGTALLVVKRGPNAGSRFQLDVPLATAGRHTTGQVQAAWIIKERLRMLLDSGTDESPAAQRLWRFQTIAADSGLPEAATLAGMIDTWWPAIQVALAEGVSNGPTEGYNRISKQTMRVACGFRSMTNYRRRIMVHIAVTRQRQTAA